MQITNSNMSMTRGDSESFTVFYTDASGINIPLVTGDTIYFTVKNSIYTKDTILQKVITEFNDGKAVIVITHIDTKDIPYGLYYYDIQLTKTDGTVTTIIPPSNFSITGEVTYE